VCHALAIARQHSTASGAAALGGGMIGSQKKVKKHCFLICEGLSLVAK
jgi:hypothetical protein